jgi:hypothetical protein
MPPAYLPDPSAGARTSPSGRAAAVTGPGGLFVAVSFWESRAAIEAFAGQDIDTAVFYPDDEQILIERDLTVKHYEVAGAW